MEKTTIEARNLYLLNTLFEIHYFDRGYRIVGSPTKKFNWIKLRFIYYLELERKEPERIIEVIENESEIENIKSEFIYQAPNGSLYKKIFWHSKEFNRQNEFIYWINDIKQNKL